MHVETSIYRVSITRILKDAINRVSTIRSPIFKCSISKQNTLLKKQLNPDSKRPPKALLELPDPPYPLLISLPVR